MIASLYVASTPALAAPIAQDWLQEKVDAARDANRLVALGAIVATLDEDPIIAVSGETYKGSDEPAGPEAAWHIGSNTKALTALLYSRLVEAGRAEWGATLPELLPGLAAEMDPAWADTTIEDLFAHRSGIGGLGPFWLIARHADSDPLTEQRYETARQRLSAPPQGQPGAFEYSNLNYIVAGAAIEQILEMSWEDAITDHVFEANGSTWADGWGFGPPQEGLRGHKRGMFGKSPVSRTDSGDNPAALGPAGTLHATLASHARLLLEFLDDDSRLIPAAQRAHLLSPWPDESADYAMGWGVSEDPLLGQIYSHNGSNTFWLSRVMLVPRENTVVIINATEFTEESRKATNGLLTAIGQKLAE